MDWTVDWVVDEEAEAGVLASLMRDFRAQVGLAPDPPGRDEATSGLAVGGSGEGGRDPTSGLAVGEYGEILGERVLVLSRCDCSALVRFVEGEGEEQWVPDAQLDTKTD